MRILVGYDGSESAQRALDRAIAEAREHHANITVISVVELPLSPDVPRYFGTLSDISADEGGELSPPPDVVEHLKDARDQLAKAGVEANLVWGAGEPGRTIVDAAKDLGVQTIILGEHHHGFLGGLFGSDVDVEVQREAGC